MLETFTDFMIFEVKDNGEYPRLNISEKTFRQNNGNNVLKPLQSVIIVKEELRRIYLWKGMSSTVRKKFIASRVASEIQRELTNSSNFHRCKIVSVDQGDEPKEFLKSFDFQKNPIIIDNDVPIVYNIGNIDTSNNGAQLRGERFIIKDRQLEYKETKDFTYSTEKSPSYEYLKKIQKTEEILEKVLKSSTPEHFTRKNILIGNSILYGEIIKKAEVFSNQIEEKGWEEISSFPTDIFEIEGAKLRIRINKELREIEAIEILEKTQIYENLIEKHKNTDYKKWTVKQLKQYCHKNAIKIPSSYRKADIVRLVLNFNSLQK